MGELASQPPTLEHSDVEAVISELNITEKIALLSGIDFWHTAPVHRLGIPSIRLSDGPNGVRGTKFFNGVPSACLPCGTGLAATWDTSLIEKAGVLQGTEAKAKGASVILGPTTNMQRSPLGGRGFESFSEDPYLAGAMTGATVAGIQSTGVAATVKHFVANDQEHERMSQDSIVSERALREIYLMPFQIAQRDARPWCYMTAYNRLNGTHVSENAKILREVLRKEWEFEGLIMSDWYGTYSAVESIKAGLDLEMPGPSYARGSQVSNALVSRKLYPEHIDACVRQLLKLVKKVQPLCIPENAPELTIDNAQTSQDLRTLSSSGLVLLKNENNVLPFKKEKTTAVIGPNAAIAAYCGGGSAALSPYYAITPLDGVRAHCPATKYSIGVPAWKKLPYMSYRTKTRDGSKGLTMKIFLDPPSKKHREQIDEIHVTKSECILMDYMHPKLPKTNLYWATLEGTFIPEETCLFEFSLSVCGTGRIFVDGNMVVDNETEQTLGDSFFGAGTHEETGRLMLEEGKEYNIFVTFGTMPTMTRRKPGVTGFGAGGLRLGLERVVDYEVELDRAVKLAKSSDQVVLCVGLNSDWESEGYDREHMNLPPGSDQLISAVLSANPNTVVVNQSGTPVTMTSWVDKAPAVIQAWYGGNETGNAIADVVFGEVNPSGKLPLTFPLRNEDNPAFLNYRSERGRVVYGEGVYIGYRFYEKTLREVAFPFGHGLSYTTFSLSDPKVTDSLSEIIVNMTVNNTGKVDGAEVVQVYISPQLPSVSRPPKELKGFTKTFLKTGSAEQVELRINKRYACSFWDEHAESWIMELGKYDVLVGTSSACVQKFGEVEVEKTSFWKGL